jgi:hypothetical protein
MGWQPTRAGLTATLKLQLVLQTHIVYMQAGNVCNNEEVATCDITISRAESPASSAPVPTAFAQQRSACECSAIALQRSPCLHAAHLQGEHKNQCAPHKFKGLHLHMFKLN